MIKKSELQTGRGHSLSLSVPAKMPITSVKTGFITKRFVKTLAIAISLPDGSTATRGIKNIITPEKISEKISFLLILTAPYNFLSLAYAAISLFLPTDSNSISKSASRSNGVTERIVPVPNFICETLSPVVKFMFEKEGCAAGF